MDKTCIQLTIEKKSNILSVKIWYTFTFIANMSKNHKDISKGVLLMM